MFGRVRLAVFLAGLVAVASFGPAHAKSDKAKGPDKGNASTSGSAAAAAAAAGAVLAGVLLSDLDRTTITRYFQQNPQPPASLPPGIAKNVARGKPIPPGIAKRGVPNALTGQLAIPRGYELQTVGADVVLIEAGTRIVADVLKDVLRK